MMHDYDANGNEYCDANSNIKVLLLDGPTNTSSLREWRWIVLGAFLCGTAVLALVLSRNTAIAQPYAGRPLLTNASAISDKLSDISDWNTCWSGDRCSSKFVCCVAQADIYSQKSTCRPSWDCASSIPKNIVNDWNTCNTNTDTCLSSGFTCCVASVDLWQAKKTCRPQTYCSGAHLPTNQKSLSLVDYIPYISQSGLGVCLRAHNQVRSFLNLPGFTWDDNLQNQAQSYANFLDQYNLFQHSNAAGQGENLYKGTGSCGNAVVLFYAERPNYHGEPIGWGNFEAYGHYTQLIWPTTTNVGCGIAGITVVCRYSPPGNYAGQKLINY